MATAMAAVGAGMTTSCNDFLEVEPHNIITEDMFWNEKGDIESILMGCYSKMQESSVVSRMMIWGEFRSENLVVGSNCAADDQSLERLLKENITATNAYTYYGDFYTVINRCNTVLKYAPQVSEKDPSYTEAQMKTHLAEATALRSLMYFYLIRTFRDVPYSEEAYQDDSQELALPATPFEEILPKLIASLEEVVKDAPDSYAQLSDDAKFFNTGRITKCAIYAMLTDMCLWNKEYQKCIGYAQKVIEFKKQQFEGSDEFKEDVDYQFTGGYPLIPSTYNRAVEEYGRDFNSIFVQGNSIESIFEINYIKNQDKGQASNYAYSNILGNTGDRAAFAVFSSFVATDQIDKAFNVFNPDNNGYDARGYSTFAYVSERPAYIAKNTNESAISLSKLDLSESNPKGLETFFNKSRWGSRYGVYTEGSDKYKAWNRSNVILYRVSDVMLLAAEAYAQLIQEPTANITDGADKENLDKAFELVNAVNLRSLMNTASSNKLKAASYNTKVKIVNLVEGERHRELLYEGKRYFDLVRRAMRDGEEGLANLRDHCSNKSGDMKTAIQAKMSRMEAIFMPYNLDELKANPKLKQNPAFNSGENDKTSIN